MLKKGVIIGCDHVAEKFLPWWWKHYSCTNSYPLTIVDFGMSKSALSWCKERGSILSSRSSLTMHPVPKIHQHLWEKAYGEGIWLFRKTWFKKPLALLQAPYALNLWLDLDCKVEKNLSPLFARIKPSSEIALARDVKSILEPEIPNYNAGVILFRHHAPVIQHWAHFATVHNELYAGDQNALNHAIEQQRPQMDILDPTCNWLMHQGRHEAALISHFTGGRGKRMILETEDFSYSR